MKTTCPACGAVSSLDVLLGNDGAREAVMAALEMPAPVGKLLVQYLGLFRPAQRQLSFDRVANILNELLPMIRDAKIERGGRIWSAPQEYWKSAIEDMLTKRDRLTLPLKNHGYLLTIIESYSNKAEAKAEAQTESKRGGHTQVGGASLPRVERVPVPQPPKPRSKIPHEVLALANTKSSKKGGIDGNQ